MRAKNSLVVCLVFGFSVLPPASATVINTYTSFTTWEAETAPGFTSIVFPGTTSTGNSLTLSGANFGTSGSEVFEVIDPTGTFLNYGAGLELEVVPSGSQSVLQITLPAGITSFGLNLTAFYNNPVTVTVNGTAYSVPSFMPSNGGLSFFGATFTAPITSFAIAAPSGDYLIEDNLAFGVQNDTSGGGGGGDPSPTPEAASLLMIGSGLIAMRLASKRIHFFGA